MNPLSPSSPGPAHGEPACKKRRIGSEDPQSSGAPAPRLGWQQRLEAALGPSCPGRAGTASAAARALAAFRRLPTDVILIVRDYADDTHWEEVNARPERYRHLDPGSFTRVVSQEAVDLLPANLAAVPADHFKPIAQALIARSPSTILLLSPHQPHHRAVILEAVERDPHALRHVQRPDAGLVKAAVERDAAAIRHVRDPVAVDDASLAAVVAYDAVARRDAETCRVILELGIDRPRHAQYQQVWQDHVKAQIQLQDSRRSEREAATAATEGGESATDREPH